MEAEGTKTINSAAPTFLSSNDDLFNDTVSPSDNRKGNASEDEGFFSGSEEFEAPVDKPVLGGTEQEAVEGSYSDVMFGDSLDKVESFLSSEENLDDDSAEGDENKEFEGGGNEVEDVSGGDHSTDAENVVGVETGDGKSEVVDSVLSSTEDLETTRGNYEVEGAEAGGEKSTKSVTDVSLSVEDAASEPEKIDVSDGLTVEPEVFVAQVEENGDAPIEENGDAPVDSADKLKPDGENGLFIDEAPEELKPVVSSEPISAIQSQGIEDVEVQMDAGVSTENPISESDTESKSDAFNEVAKRLIEELERESEADESYSEELENVGDSQTVAEVSPKHSEVIDGQIVTDSEEDGDSDDDGGDGKELFDSAALAALLKAATGADSDGGTITITSEDGSRLFSVERPAGLGPALRSLRPAAARFSRPGLFSTSNVVESETNLTEDEKKKLIKLQEIRVKYLRLVHRLGLSPEEPTAEQVLYRLQLLGGRQNLQFFSFDDAKKSALELEAQGKDDLDFSLNILVLGKHGAGKSSTINSLFGEERVPISAFDKGTTTAKEVFGLIDGIKVRVFDTPGLKASAMEQNFNRAALSSVKKMMKKTPSDVVLYVDRLDSQSRDLDDLPLLKTATTALGSSIWRNGVVTLTHAGSAPPDGPSGAPMSYEVFISQRSRVVQQSIAHSVGDIRMMSSGLMNPVSLVENHPSCRRNREGQKVLPNGQSWRPQLLLLCYSMKILSEASSLAKPPQDAFDHMKLFGFRVRSPPLPYMLSSMLQSRPHPKLQMDQGGENFDSEDIDMDDLLDLDQEEEEDEYDQLPAFRPLRKSQVELLSKEQKKAYFEEYDYRVKLLHKKQWKEELMRMKEMKKKGNAAAVAPDYGFPEDDPESEAAAPIRVPLPDMALPPTFDGDNPGYRYRFLEPVSQFLARPVLVTNGWDHDCGYDAVNLDHSLAIANRFPASYTIQVSKDKKDFSISLDSSIAARYGDNISTMANFDIQSMGKQLAYVLRAESKFSKIKKHKPGGGISVTFLGENIVPGLKIEDHISLGKQYALVGSAGAVKSQSDTAFGANIELQRREIDYPIGQVQSTLSMSAVKWRGDLALGFNALAQFSVGRNSKIAVRAGINNKLSGQITVRTSSSEHLSLALAAFIPLANSIYHKLWPSVGDNYSIY